LCGVDHPSRHASLFHFWLSVFEEARESLEGEVIGYA
jgi:hypothetical protein